MPAGDVSGTGAGRRSDPRPAPAAGWALAGLAVLVAAGLWFRLVEAGPVGLDEWWHGATGVTRGSAPFAVAVFLAEVGGGFGAAACTAIAAALLLALRRPRDAGAVVTASLLGVVLSELGKAVVLRPRPWDPLYPAHDTSFPSGHSMGAAALAVSLALVARGAEAVPRAAARWVAAAALAWVLVMMWSRTALHVHWLSDALAGALLGICAAVLARWVWFRPAGIPRRAA